MGLFSFNYAKPGPGVEKDAPKKKGIFLYFELLGRKFFKLCQVNMLYFLCSIPYLVLMFLLITGMFGSKFGKIMEILAVEGASDETVSTVMLMLSSCITMLVYALWGAGPASASFAYVTRCFTREEHSWILSDFFKIFKENFKQGMIMVVVDFVAFFLMINAIFMYWNMYVQNNQFMYMLLAYFCVMMFIIYTFMHFIFDAIVNKLHGKGNVLASKGDMYNICRTHNEWALTKPYGGLWGFRITTDDYTLYVRCSTVRDDYNFYIYCYDKNMLMRIFSN